MVILRRHGGDGFFVMMMVAFLVGTVLVIMVAVMISVMGARTTKRLV